MATIQAVHAPILWNQSQELKVIPMGGSTLKLYSAWYDEVMRAEMQSKLTH